MTRWLPDPGEGSVQEQAVQWFLHNRDGAMDAAQRAALLAWMQRSPEHVRAYLEVLDLYRLVGEALAQPRLQGQQGQGSAPPTRGLPAASAKVVPLFAPSPMSAAPMPSRARRGWMAAAAVAGVALLTGALLMLQPHEQLLIAGHGQLREVMLADRTHVRLNADSRVRVRMDWRSRQVELLQGEASFDVGADRRPFEVRVDGLQIRDIGTMFDVSRRLQGTRIGVVSGRVEVWSAGSDARRLAQLEAGRVVLVDARSQAVHTLDMPATMLLDWQQRRVSFLEERLDEVAAAFNRHNRAQVVVADDVAAAMRLSGSLQAHRIAVLQAFLERDGRFVVERRGDTLRVSSR